MSLPAGPPSTLEDAELPSFPLDAWYAAAWDHEVGRDLRPVRLADLPVVLYRRRDGTPVALADACWHRLVPLSMGALVDDDLMCGYHGIRYDGDGRATFMPAQQTINPSACVRSYPVVDAHRYVWVWPGDPAKADPALVPDMHWNDDPGWAGDGKTIEARCDYRLVVDNLMDLTHEAFVHSTSLANAELNEAELDVTHSGRTVTVTRWMLGIQPPPFWAGQLASRFPGYDGPVDRWQIIHFTAPSTICIDVGVAKAGTGAPEGDRSQGVNNYILNTMTPQTRTTCHYFWANARSYALGDQRTTTLLREGVSRVFFEDETMLNAQQAAIEANSSHEFYNLNIDAGGMWARRAIQAMIDAELAPGARSGAHVVA
ncbi:MAG TPA: aromatic ring-hydroxylating dioxygenase subunit alpha [Actinomycetales bacterium]|jgi:vanillate O-demethylase monooxygenase subunit